jgi:CheY-like chemotaxis protein
MLKTTITPTSLNLSPYDVANATDTQRVMIVNGCTGILELIETILRAGRYDVVFVESSDHAYSQIKRLQPDLVILCVRLDHVDGFHVLTMLKLDEATRDIPLLTYATSSDSDEMEEEPQERLETEMFTPKSMELMN